MCVYIYRAVRRGKSLQESTNPLTRSTAMTPSSFLSQTHADCKHLAPGWPSPQMPEEKGYSGPSCTPHSLGKAAVPTGSWPFQNLVPK